MDTPSSHTLAGVLTLLRAGSRGQDDPQLASKLDEAFAKHEVALRSYCRSWMRGASPQQLEDLVQEVLLEAWTKLDQYEPRAPFRSWLLVIARFKCAGARRKLSDALSEDGFLDDVAEEPTVLTALADAERDALIEEASRNVLDDAEQELVYLRWVLDYPLPDVAREQGLADANEVRVALQRCKRRLQKEVGRLLAARGLGASFLG